MEIVVSKSRFLSTYAPFEVVRGMKLASEPRKSNLCGKHSSGFQKQDEVSFGLKEMIWLPFAGRSKGPVQPESGKETKQPLSGQQPH
jgi:hypothetical protein